MRRTAGVLLAVVLALVVSSCKFDGAYDLPLPGGKAVSEDDAITVTAVFADALHVVPRTAVMVDDVPIGQVSSIERDGWNAKVTMLVRKDLDLPTNTTADIRQTSLLGEKYIALLAPVQDPVGRLADGAVIGLERTGANPEVEEVLGALAFVLSGGGVEQIRTISVEVNKMLSGRTGDARGALTNITKLVSTLDTQKGSIVKAMSAVDRLARTLNAESKTFGDAIDAMGPALKILSAQQKALTRMLTELDKLGAVGTRVVRQSKADIVATLRHLAPTLRSLAAAGDSLPRGLSMMLSFPFPKEAADLAMGDYANALFNVDFDLSKLFSSGAPGDTSGIPNPIEICKATPAAPICQILDDTVIKQLCKLLPTSPLCPGKSGNGTLGQFLTGLLGGSSRTTATPGTAQGDQGSGLAGLLGGGSS